MPSPTYSLLHSRPLGGTPYHTLAHEYSNTPNHPHSLNSYAIAQPARLCPLCRRVCMLDSPLSKARSAPCTPACSPPRSGVHGAASARRRRHPKFAQRRACPPRRFGEDWSTVLEQNRAYNAIDA
eukprot:3580393-Pleurochrysis_carterae.AAC.1